MNEPVTPTTPEELPGLWAQYEGTTLQIISECPDPFMVDGQELSNKRRNKFWIQVNGEVKLGCFDRWEGKYDDKIKFYNQDPRVKDIDFRAALERCEAQVTERDERIKALEKQLERLPHAEAERIQALNDYRELEQAYHKLLNDYRCALATFKAAVEVAQYELEYVTKP